MAKMHGTTEAKPGVAGKALPAIAAEAKTPGEKLVRVRATKMGFYGNARRWPGAVFDLVITNGQKLPSWVVLDTGESAAGSTSAASAEASGDSSGDVL